MQSIISLLNALQIHRQSLQNISFVPVHGHEEGTDIAEKLLSNVLNSKTALFLSGGETPKDLYRKLAVSEVMVGAMGMIDERFGEKFHANSNEVTIQDSGLLRYLSLVDRPWSPILTRQTTDIAETSEIYDNKLRSMITQYQQLIGVLGIGEDGHTAGIAPTRHDFTNPLFTRKNFAYVDWFDDLNGTFKKRVTMTFLGLSMLDIYIVLVFGDNKKKALQHMFEKGSEEDIPARFYIRPEIAKKTIIISDQEII